MAKKNKGFKNRIGVVYSTSEEYQYNENEEIEEDTLPNNQQMLRVELDKKNRRGKKVTLITGYTGMTGDLKELGKLLKSKCGVGGNVKDREILIQGDFRQKVGEILTKAGFKVKII